MPRKSLQTLSEPMYYVLLSLTSNLCGTEIMKEVEKISNGRVKIGPGTLYTMLAKFLDMGLVDQPYYENRKRIYEITELGKQVLVEEYERLKRMSDDGRNIVQFLR
ncbi:MAG: PadR family transcriptional regulator [Faecalibacterium sp.]|nr:PadR family transcriptional regulator [Ruminococcus sp.]MCM1393245.1 PadR family transcriptional regulator [Ruminococcus sp.]MCM1486468.1 PadR family transcriptional regulator [Faecalibacterium sp.]